MPPTVAQKKIPAQPEGRAEIAQKIDETDEMKIQMLAGIDRSDPEDLLYPPELNAHLLEQLKTLTAENGELRNCIFLKDKEIEELNKTVTSVNQRIRDIIAGSAPGISSKSAGIISAKITELCKTNRHLVAEISGYKSKNVALERKVLQLELLTRDQENLEICICKDDPPELEPNELKELNNKLAHVNKKLLESKNKNLELKNDILLATRVLQQELGVKVTNLKELQCDIAGWKGRAEQIIKLQAKIAELEDKLGQSKEAYDPKRPDQKQILKEMEIKKKKEIDQALKEAKQSKEDNADLKSKLDAAKCRIRNLECEVHLTKQKMQTLLDKSNHDDLLINEQREQNKSMELYYQDLLRENTSKMNKMTGDLLEYKKLLHNTDDKIEALRKKSSEKACKIEELRAQLLRYEECSLQSVFFTPMKTATDNEIKCLSEMVKTMNRRLDEERRKCDELDAQQRKIKERKKKVERKLRALEEELARSKELKKGSRSRVSVGKNGSEEFGIHSSKPSQSSGVISEKSSENTTESTDENTLETLDKADLKYKLEITEERLKIMEDKLKMIEEEKQEDFDNLTEMIQTSKQLFNEALAVLQREKCMCT